MPAREQDVAPPTPEESLESLLQQIVTDQTPPALKQLLLHSAESFIHPVLARSRWTTINNEDYMRIVPAIAVATRMLTGDRAMHFWHALLIGPESATDETHEQFLCTFENPEIDLPAEEREKVERMPNELAQIVVFDCEDLIDDIFAITWITDAHVSPDAPGVRSHITLRRALVDEIDLHVRPPYAILRRWFIIAATLLHEVAHALRAARHGCKQEKEFEDDGFIEIGCAMEKWLFGGQVFLSWADSADECIVLHEVECDCYKEPEEALAEALFASSTGIGCEVQTDEWVEKLFVLVLREAGHH